MDANGAKQPKKDIPTMMKEMMQAMCCTGEFSPADMCERMMRSMGERSDAEAQSAPESAMTSDERGRGGEEETSRGSCGPRSGCAAKRP